MGMDEIQEKMGALYSIMESGKLQLKCMRLTPGINASLKLLASMWYPEDPEQEKLQYTLEDLLTLGHLLNMIETTEELRIVLEEILEYKQARKKWMNRLKKYREDRRKDKTLQKYEVLLNTLASTWKLRVETPWNRIPLPSAVFIDTLKTVIGRDRRTVKKNLQEFMSLGLIRIKLCKSIPPALDSCVEITNLARNLAESYYNARNKEKAKKELFRAFVETGLSELSPNISTRTVNTLNEKGLSLDDMYQVILEAMINAISSSRLYSPHIIVELLVLPLQTVEEGLTNEESLKRKILGLYPSKTPTESSTRP